MGGGAGDAGRAPVHGPACEQVHAPLAVEVSEQDLRVAAYEAGDAVLYVEMVWHHKSETSVFNFLQQGLRIPVLISGFSPALRFPNSNTRIRLHRSFDYEKRKPTGNASL